MSVVDPATPSPIPSGRTPLILGLVLAALVFAAFQPALNNDFVGYDDPDYVTANVMVQRGLTDESIAWAFRSTAAANWHPLTWLSHMLDVQLFELNPAGHHLTSIVLHTLSVGLLFVTLRTMTGSTWRSFFVAALFGLHPLRAESVVWAAERKDVLSTFFWLLTTLVYVRYVKSAGMNQTRSYAMLALAVFCFACGLMAKPMLVTLPFTLLLLDVWPLKRLGQRKFSLLVLEKTPFFVLSAVASGVTFFVQRGAGAVDEYMTFGYRLGNALVAFIRYLGKTFWPADLAFFYPHPERWPMTAIAGAAMLLLAISALALHFRKRHPSLLVGWCWYLGTLVPVIGLVQVGQQSIADRYTYIPSIGLLIALVWSVHALVANRLRLARVLALGAGLALVGGVYLTRQQSQVWRSTEALCRHAIAVTRNNYLAHDMLGAALEKKGLKDEALHEHLRALEIKPNYADAHNNLAVALHHQGRLAEAVEHYQRALQLRPRYPEAHYNLAVALEAAGQYDNAITEYTKAIAQHRHYSDAHYNLGRLYGQLGRLNDAVGQFQEVLRINPQHVEAHNNLGVAFARLGRFDAALYHYQQAIQFDPGYARVHFNLGVAFLNLGRLPEAKVQFETAIRLDPNYSAAHTNLAVVQTLLNKPLPP